MDNRTISLQQANRSRIATGVLAVVFVLVLSGCVQQKPVLYETDSDGSQRAVETCGQRAADHGLDYDDGGRLARQSAENGAVGAAGGAAGGAVYGNASGGAAAGAVGGVTTGITRFLFSENAPAPIYRRYVNRCLRTKGYHPVGWQ